MAEDLIDYGKTRIKAKSFVGAVSGEVAASDVTVAAGTDGLSAGNLQATLQDIYTILDGKADA